MPEVRRLDGPGGPVLENGRGRLAGRLAAGAVWGARGGRRGGAAPAAGGRQPPPGPPPPGEPVLALDVTLYEEQPFVALQSHLTNAAGTPLTVQAFHVVRTAPITAGDGWGFYRHGWQSRRPA